MSAPTYGQLTMWFARGREQGATHMVVGYDITYQSYYPVYVNPDEDAKVILEREDNRTSGATARRCYALWKDAGSQIRTHRIVCDTQDAPLPAEYADAIRRDQERKLSHTTTRQGDE